MIALVCGIASVRSGFQPACYFVLAFIAILIPGPIILPTNLGLTPELVDNSELLTLLGGTLDALLLAFALADKIQLLAHEKEHVLEELEHTVTLAHTDHLTGIANRHAFDQQFKLDFDASKRNAESEKQILFLIDLDGLKSVNDRFGHARGDELLRAFAKAS